MRFLLISTTYLSQSHCLLICVSIVTEEQNENGSVMAKGQQRDFHQEQHVDTFTTTKSRQVHDLKERQIEDSVIFVPSTVKEKVPAFQQLGNKFLEKESNSLELCDCGKNVHQQCHNSVCFTCNLYFPRTYIYCFLGNLNQGTWC